MIGQKRRHCQEMSNACQDLSPLPMLFHRLFDILTSKIGAARFVLQAAPDLNGKNLADEKEDGVSPRPLVLHLPQVLICDADLQA